MHRLEIDFHEAIRDALNLVDPVVDFNAFDVDLDRSIDFITFLHSGYGAEWGDTDAYGAYLDQRIWSHKWALDSAPGPWVSSEGVSVYSYHISPVVWGLSGNSIGRIGTIAHETGHFLGLPDLYDTTGGGNGLGAWCLMANSWGFDNNQYYPPQMSGKCFVLCRVFPNGEYDTDLHNQWTNQSSLVEDSIGLVDACKSILWLKQGSCVRAQHSFTAQSIQNHKWISC